MKNYFPDYEGGADYAAACDYILNRFVSLNQAETEADLHSFHLRH